MYIPAIYKRKPHGVVLNCCRGILQIAHIQKELGYTTLFLLYNFTTKDIAQRQQAQAIATITLPSSERVPSSYDHGLLSVAGWRSRVSFYTYLSFFPVVFARLPTEVCLFA